jgi:hypothetical protein
VLVDAVAEEGLQFIPTHPELFQVRTFFLAVALGDFVLTNRQAIPIKQHRRLEKYQKIIVNAAAVARIT